MIPILLLFGMFRLNMAFNFTTLDQSTGAFLAKAHDTYISYNNWRFIYFYELNDYYSDIDTFRECFIKMEEICSSLIEKEPCEALVKRYQNIMIDINIDVEYIKSVQSKRRKREAILGFIGSYVHKPLFGLMDEDDAIEIYDKINEIIVKQDIHTRILEDNISIIQRTIKLTNNTIQNFRTNIDQLNNYLLNISSTLITAEQEIKQHINFKYLSSLATLITFEHERMTRRIKDILKNTLRGEFTELITYEQLMADIHEVSSDMDDSSFMIMNSLRDIQQVVSIQGTIINKRMMIEVTIPILSKSLFKLNKIIPLPMRYKDEAIILDIENQHFLVNKGSRVYIPIHLTDVQNCRSILNRTSLICYPQTEMYFENEKSCESNILFEQNTTDFIQTCSYKHIADINYIKRINEKSYFVGVKEPLQVRENCIKQITQFYTLNTTGILTMNLNCEIILNGMKITTRNTKNSEKLSEILKPHKYTKIIIENMTLIEPRLDEIKLQKVKYLSHDEDLNAMINTTNRDLILLKRSGIVTRIESGIFKRNLVFITIIISLIVIIKIICNKIC